jgi:hypothetical protein
VKLILFDKTDDETLCFAPLFISSGLFVLPRSISSREGCQVELSDLLHAVLSTHWGCHSSCFKRLYHAKLNSPMKFLHFSQLGKLTTTHLIKASYSFWLIFNPRAHSFEMSNSSCPRKVDTPVMSIFPYTIKTIWRTIIYPAGQSRKGFMVLALCGFLHWISSLLSLRLSNFTHVFCIILCFLPLSLRH